jgi:hypothetical protein
MDKEEFNQKLEKLLYKKVILEKEHKDYKEITKAYTPGQKVLFTSSDPAIPKTFFVELNYREVLSEMDRRIAKIKDEIYYLFQDYINNIGVEDETNT